ncbi:MAG: 4-(cytidine 5'-diphospho)-2-C-methyl-D-erythritol kinase [Flavobacteriales bacterium]|nr:4-(cytidine 5'-diphospho)-2-C-methyl-D-erythritol kinase [Flavobacteriales bacterium]|tara:strand:+ start:8868 stop:9677 length:810 start_codon:yes stop_codon:yes gene_type:complete
MVIFPNAKINLGLHITEKRPDGYHNIESVFIPVPINDALEITKNQTNKTNFSSTGIKIPADGKPNLVERAFSILQSKYQIPTVDIELIKNIPIGAGLGGGSADAAACILILNKLFDLQLSHKEQLNLASQLGADCAFFIKNKIMYIEGIGDKFTDITLDLSNYHFIVIYPDIHVSTFDAYKHVTPKKPSNNIREILSKPIETWKNQLKNDFEISIFKQYPKIEKIKNQLYNSGAIYASMSGSGSTVYGIFKNPPETSFENLGKNWSFVM